MKQFFILASCTALALLTTSCAGPSQGSKVYTRGQAQQPLQVFSGTVLKVEEVAIQAQETGRGATAGAIAGRAIGSNVGKGRGNDLAKTGGVLLGAKAGSAAERNSGTKPALEIEVELDDGRLMVIVQEKDDEFAVGDRIRVVQDRAGTMRVRQ